MSDPITQPQHDDDLDLDWYDDEDEPDPGPEQQAPRRPRRRLVTPASAGLAAVALLAAGFIGGVQVQKHQGGGAGTAGGARGALPGGFAARLGAGRQGGASGSGSGATVGTVANVKGSTLYVTTSEGTTVKVKTTDNSKVTRNASSSAASVHPGDSVVIQGETAAGGTVTASSIAATAKGVSAAAAAGGPAVQVPQGFTPPGG